MCLPVGRLRVRLFGPLLALAGLLLTLPTMARAQGEVFLHDRELTVPLPQLDLWRNRHPQLQAEVRLSGAQGERSLKIALTDPVHAGALVFDLSDFPGCNRVQLEVKAGGVLVHRQDSSPVRVSIAAPAGMQDWPLAALELGAHSPAGSAPQIALPDAARLRVASLALPARVHSQREITFAVEADADLPGIGSNNYVLVSRQSFAPDDPQQCSLYFSYRKPLYNAATGQLAEWRKMLVEVPVARDWLQRGGDETLNLSLDQFAIHTTEERELAGERWNAPQGNNLLGNSSSGLFQGGQTADIDDLGRIYISNCADGAGLVRFNPQTGKFEQPPINLLAEARKFLPTGDGWKRNWDQDLAQVVCTRGRVYLVFDRNYRVRTPNGDFETCSGVISLPQDKWNDADDFRRDVRLHAGCWPSAEHPLYPDELAVGPARRAGSPTATTQGLTFGNFRLDLDAQGNTTRLAVIKSLSDATDAAGRPLPPASALLERGLRKQRLINVGGAGRPLVQQAYGQFTMRRAALPLLFPDAPAELLAGPTGEARTLAPDGPPGELTVRFDIAGKLRREPARYGRLAAELSGPSQGPGYALVAIPGQAGQAIGVCDYNYYYSRLDFSRRQTTGKVYKSYVTETHDGQPSGFPLAARLGPYNLAWVRHDASLWLYAVGYTGISRLPFATPGAAPRSQSAEVIHQRLVPQPVDGVSRESVKDYLHLLPALEGRLLNIGRGRSGRGGGAHSAGLELFDPRTLGASQTAVAMNRAYGLYTPVSRVVYSASGAAPRQEVFVASGTIHPEYVADLPPDRRPANQEPKVFAYEISAAGGLRDLFGFALPKLPSGAAAANLALSRCGQYLVLLQAEGVLWTWRIADRRFVDGVRLQGPAGEPQPVLEFSRPSATLWTAPAGQMFFFTAAGPAGAPSGVQFFEVAVSPQGRLTVSPHLAVAWEKGGRLRDYDNVIRGFLPDLTHRDGSYDLVLGCDTENGGQPLVRVLDDFIPPVK